MKRDMALVRSILLWIESDGHKDDDIPNVEGFTEEVVTYNVRLLIDEGYIEGKHIQVASGDYYIAYIGALTWTGHDFLDAIRDDSVWEQVKQKLGDNASTMPLEVVKGAGIEVIKSLVGVIVRWYTGLDSALKAAWTRVYLTMCVLRNKRQEKMDTASRETAVRAGSAM